MWCFKINILIIILILSICLHKILTNLGLLSNKKYGMQTSKYFRTALKILLDVILGAQF